MNIWYLLKCWLKILMIARQEKVNTNVVMNKILKSNNSLESLPFLPFYLSISCAFWYTIVTIVGSVLYLLYPISNVVMFIHLFVVNTICLFCINRCFTKHEPYRMYCIASLFQKHSSVYIRVYTSNEEIGKIMNIERLLSTDDNYNRQLYKLYSDVEHLQLVNTKVIIPLLKINHSLQSNLFSLEKDETFSIYVYNEADNYKKSYVLFFDKQVENSIKLIDYTTT